MSTERIESLIFDFPFNFRDPILGYANSVKIALPSIFREAGLKRDNVLEDEIVFIAGVKKLYAIVSSTFWTLRKALTYLEESGIPMVKVADRQYSLKSPEYRRLRNLYDSLRGLLEEENLARFMDESNYVYIVRILADERGQA